eukprot:1159738-Pelagomonas_calceolata.AAC.4
MADSGLSNQAVQSASIIEWCWDVDPTPLKLIAPTLVWRIHCRPFLHREDLNMMGFVSLITNTTRHSGNMMAAGGVEICKNWNVKVCTYCHVELVKPALPVRDEAMESYMALAIPGARCTPVIKGASLSLAAACTIACV